MLHKTCWLATYYLQFCINYIICQKKNNMHKGNWFTSYTAVSTAQSHEFHRASLKWLNSLLPPIGYIILFYKFAQVQSFFLIPLLIPPHCDHSTICDHSAYKYYVGATCHSVCKSLLSHYWLYMSNPVSAVKIRKPRFLKICRICLMRFQGGDSVELSITGKLTINCLFVTFKMGK